MNLFVTGLLPDMDDTDLKEMFELYGEIKSARVVMDRNTGKSRMFGFVEMTNDDEAKETISLLNGAKMGKYKMSVQEAQQQGDGNSGGGAPRRSFDNNGPRRSYDSNGPRRSYDNNGPRRNYNNGNDRNNNYGGGNRY
jgi:RNA recognition motif-containing protein